MNDHTHLRREEPEPEAKGLLSKESKDVHTHSETGREILDRIKHIGDLIQTVTISIHFEIINIIGRNNILKIRIHSPLILLGWIRNHTILLGRTQTRNSIHYNCLLSWWCYFHFSRLHRNENCRVL